ncbi:hypothetical protein DESC_770112 [Desulfosarcina cetonica]|nr:hypothetical protein DESC_770112 [Desulfosarcina cetonica]
MVSGHSSVGRVQASQAWCREFESRCPLHFKSGFVCSGSGCWNKGGFPAWRGADGLVDDGIHNRFENGNGRFARFCFFGLMRRWPSALKKQKRRPVLRRNPNCRPSSA